MIFMYGGGGLLRLSFDVFVDCLNWSVCYGELVGLRMFRVELILVFVVRSLVIWSLLNVVEVLFWRYDIVIDLVLSELVFMNSVRIVVVV